MYNEHFGLSENPFSIAPDPRYLFMSNLHREALAHLVYGMESDGGFVLLTGEVGTGKTTVCRCLLEQIPEHCDVAFLLNPKVTATELLATICDEFGLDYPADSSSNKGFIDRINNFLLDGHGRGHKAVLIIDEAQNLSSDVLEQIRLLTNLETNQRKLLQIILLGQPELRDQLNRPELRQLAQRITARYHLGPLGKNEVAPYIAHRLAVAGVRKRLFAAAAIKRIHHLSHGIPRLINTLCDRALLGAYTLGHEQVGKATVNKAARELFGSQRKSKPVQNRSSLREWLLAALALLAGAAALSAAMLNQERQLLTQFVTEITTAPQKIQEPLPIPQSPPAATNPLAGLPDGLDTDRSRQQAFATLFALWSINLDPTTKTEACATATANGLQCLTKRGSLGSLLRYDRPAVLRLFDGQGHEYHATLIGQNGQGITLVLDGVATQVSLEELERHWLGEYTLLWQPPPDFQGDISPGDRSAVVLWLREQLMPHGVSQGMELISTTYDPELAERVKTFQVACGLVPDGIVGAQTIIHLKNPANTSAPRLKRAKEESPDVLYP